MNSTTNNTEDNMCEIEIIIPGGQQYFYYAEYTEALKEFLKRFTYRYEINKSNATTFQKECCNPVAIELGLEIKRNPDLLNYSEETYLENNPIINIKTINIKNN